LFNFHYGRLQPLKFDELDTEEELSDKDVNIDYSYLDDVASDEEIVLEEPMLLDPYAFVETYYGFTENAYKYMIRCLKNECKAIDEVILNVDPCFINTAKLAHEMKSSALKKWLNLQSSIGLRILPNKEERLYNKDPKVMRFNIPYIEMWEDLVKATHESRPSGKHYKTKKIVELLRIDDWLVSSKQYRIPIHYIEEFCNKYLVCSSHSTAPSTSTKKSKRNDSYDETYKNSPTSFPDFQKKLIVKHKVHLKLQQKSILQKNTNAGIVKSYICIHGGAPNPKKKKDNLQGNKNKPPRQYNTKRYCGCTFSVKVFIPYNKE
jgi:hypothetical protein